MTREDDALLNVGLRTGDYDWQEKPFKKVILLNVSDCQRISLTKLLKMWSGTGHVEWEYLLAGWFLMQVDEAVKEGQDEADITILFSRELSASRDRKFSQKKVYDHLIQWFKICDEGKKELKVRLRVE